MTILALEFSSPQRSVAVARGASVLAEAVETGGRGTNAFGLIEKVLAEAKIEREQIEAIAVGLGPGSYTGIRAAISIAQGWQLARENSGSRGLSPHRDLKLLGVGSAEVIAAEAQEKKILGRVNVVIDAQRNEIYLAAYEVAAGGLQEIAPLKIVSPAEIHAAGGEIFIGPEVTRWLPDGKIIYPRAAVLARLAAVRTDFVSDGNLEPVYLRPVEFVKAPAPRQTLS